MRSSSVPHLWRLEWSFALRVRFSLLGVGERC